MSKATVQMCISTTGFGSSAQGLHLRQTEREHSQHQKHKHNEGAANSGDYFTSNRDPPTHNQQRASTARPKPRFDMGLNDLLASPPSSHDNATALQNSQTPFQSAIAQSNLGAIQDQSRDLKMDFEYGNPSGGGVGSVQSSTAGSQTRSSIQRQASGLVEEYPLSPAMEDLNTSSIDPSLLPTSNSYPQNNTLTTSTPFSQSYPSDPFTDLQFSNLSEAAGMDLLQGNGWETASGMGNGMNGGGFVGSGGADFGMGLGLEWEGMEHDFSEGGNGGLDLFDGFFFGGAGNL